VVATRPQGVGDPSDGARSRAGAAGVDPDVVGVFGASLAAAVTGAGSAVLLLAAIAAVAYVVLMIVGDLSWVGSKPSEHHGEIVLTRVHPTFARAVDEQYGR
jgi:hypothetical protein